MMEKERNMHEKKKKKNNNNKQTTNKQQTTNNKQQQQQQTQQQQQQLLSLSLQGNRTSKEQLEPLLKDSDNHIFLAVDDISTEKPTLVGFCHVQTLTGEETKAEVGMLSVKPSEQSRGIGSLLMREALRICREDLHRDTAVMWILDGRVDLLGWYHKLGFVDTGRIEPFPDISTRVGVPREEIVGTHTLFFHVLEKSLVEAKTATDQ